MSEYSKKELRQLQLTLVEILDDFVKICDKHHLNYYLVGGTAIGAVRHSGFIPWDDDIDVAMLREDYEKFLDIAIEELPDKYFLQYEKTDKNYYLGFAKIRKNNTLFETEGCYRYKSHKGIFFDIFPIDYNPDRYSKKLRLEVVMIRSIIETLKYKNKNLYFKHIRNKLISVPLIPFTNKKLHKMLNRISKMNNKKEHNYAGIYCAQYPYQRDIYDIKTVNPPKKIMFEGKKYNVFHDVDAYLKGLYGDYMTLPPKEKQISHHSFKAWHKE